MPKDFGQDRTTEGIISVTDAEYFLHIGDSFYVDTTANLASAATVNYIILVQDNAKWTHIVPSIVATKGTEFFIFEGAGASTSATFTTFNRDRNSTTTAGTVVATVNAITTAGTLIDHEIVGSIREGGGNTRGTSEVIFAQGSNYIIRITSLENTNIVGFHPDRYENTNKA